jgi:hypothetical protein
VIAELPRWPSGGNRRRLEERWLRELEARGLTSFLPDKPVGASTAIQKAVEQFNDGRFWDCHETLEEEWLATPYPLRFFHHALIKVAVGLYHMGRQNRHGARVKLADGVRLLRLFPEVYAGVHAGRLLGDAAACLSRVSGADDVDWSELDKLPRPVVVMVGPDEPPPSA